MQSAKAFVLTANGAKIPAIGFGTMELPHRPAELVAAAIAAGYRHIDTARKYGTEERVGEGIRASGITRGELFVTTKVTELDAREADFLRSVETSLKALGLDYVDLLLIHWPQPKVPFTETLGALAKAKRSGMTRHIGVSNFTLAMLDEAVRVCPEPLITNQIEYHAYLPQDRMIAALKTYGMILTAYCPVARGKLLDDPVIGEIAKTRGKTHADLPALAGPAADGCRGAARPRGTAHRRKPRCVRFLAHRRRDAENFRVAKKEHSHRGSARARAEVGHRDGCLIFRPRRFRADHACNVTASFRPSATLKCVAD